MSKFDILVHLRSHEGESLAARVALTLARRIDAVRAARLRQVCE